MAKRIVGIGLYYETPVEGCYPDRVVEVTKAFAEEWDADLMNRGYMIRAVVAAVQDKTDECGGLSIDLAYKGHKFFTVFALEHLGSLVGDVRNKPVLK